MILVATVILLHSAGLAGSMPPMTGMPGIPENITVTFISPTSVRVSWDTSVEHIEKYDVTYKPTDARVVAIVAGNSDAVTLQHLKPDTQYQLTVAAVYGGKKYKSRPIVFRTLEPPKTTTQQDVTSDPPPSDPPEVDYPTSSATVRGVEIGIVLIVLLVWVAAIALFFNRWGKIRMLLPYQPDYKQEQLKVPGTAACAAAVAAGNTCNHHSGELCTQMTESVDSKNTPGYEIHTPSTTRKSRPRLNSAIFTSLSGPGFDSKEFLRRHGSQSRLCRKARSVDNISLDQDVDGDVDMDHLDHHHHHHHHHHHIGGGGGGGGVLQHHFGLPMLSVSGPSPPEDEEDSIVVANETDRFIRSEA